jgi:hypothetical protein
LVNPAIVAMYTDIGFAVCLGELTTQFDSAGRFTNAVANKSNSAHVERINGVVRPPRIELGLRVPETLVISLSLRARASFLTLGLRPVNVRAENGRRSGIRKSRIENREWRIDVKNAEVDD